MAIPKYGIDKEISQKLSSKYDPKRESDAKEWIEQILQQSIPVNGKPYGLIKALKDGVLLCKLAKAITPNEKINIQESNMPFKQMENINQFLNWTEKVGCPKMEMFQTVDLFEEKNPIQVLDALYSVSRNVSKQNSALPLLGPKLVEKRDVVFTEEQLTKERQRQANLENPFISFSGGANASGVQFGGRRDIGGADPNKVEKTTKS